MLTYKTEIRVRFCETDKMQFLHHAKYIEYFEVARTEMLRHYGLPYKIIEDQGYEMPIIEVSVKYKNAAFYDELLVVESSVQESPGAKMRIEYKVYKKDSNILCAEGFSDLVFIKSETKKACRPPEFFINMMKTQAELVHE